MMRGPVLLVAEEDPLPEDIDRDHLLRTDRCPQRLALLGKPLAGGDVEIVLVLEAAEQPATAAGNLGRVEREMLILGQPEVDRGELLEPGGAAVLPAAAPDARQAGGFVPDSDLAELDSGARTARRGRGPAPGSPPACRR